MPELFGVPFSQLTPERLAEFLVGAEPEPLLWEAKGGARLDPNEIRRQCGGFANSNVGGYLILGASESVDGWQLDGVEFPDREPHRFVTSCLLEGVRPLPKYDVRAFETGPQRHVAVVQVEPLDAGPCIVRGTVYERVPGATVRVKDPGRLAELFTRGESAHTSARSSAANARGLAWAAFGVSDDLDASYAEFEEQFLDEESEQDGFLYVGLGLSALSVQPDISARLFRESTRTRMIDLVEKLANMPGPFTPRIDQAVRQDRRVVRAITAMHYRADWALTGLWTGAVAVGYRTQSDGVNSSHLVHGVVLPGFRAGVALAEAIGATGPGYLKISVFNQRGGWWATVVGIGRGPIDLDADELPIASLTRELNRAAGVDDPEPEDSPEGQPHS